METPTPPVGGDDETFRRVWQRVMPQAENSPVRPNPPPPPPPHDTRPPRPLDGGDGCYSRVDPAQTDLLRRMMDGAAEDERFCRALAARAPQRAARVLRSISADERRQEQRLRAAYFILTGRQYRSPNHGGRRPAPNFLHGLREQLIAERRGSDAYRRAASGADDPCLRRLFEDLAMDEARHAQMLQTLLEQTR